VLCLAVAAKRYVLFGIDGDEVSVYKATEHGLGAYLAPVDPDTADPVERWIEAAWARIARPAVGLGAGEEPAWFGQLARTRLAISMPAMLRWFRRWNALDPTKPEGAQKPYALRVKPFGFLDHAPLDPLHPRPAGAGGFNLVAPRGERRRWANLHDPDGPRYRVVGHETASGDPCAVLGRTYGDLVLAHPGHPEPKALGPDGRSCARDTVGLLGRRPVVAGRTEYVGKEAHALERVEAGLVDDVEELLTVYERHPSEELRERLRGMRVKEGMALTGYRRRQVCYLRAGERQPRRG